NPHVDVENFRPLVVQGAGQPYSDEKVRASVTALQQTGRFSKIETDIKPENSGLRLIFILEPAYYVGIINFPGATKAFTYPRLLQVVNCPDEHAYDKSQIPEAESSLMRFLHSNGYFQAQIKTETQLDDANQLADITFDVTLGKRAKIGR